MNRSYLNRDAPTDVISFAMREGEFSEINPQLLGDVVISVETACRQAEERSISLEDELLTLLIHGILHLFGYDHENNDEKSAEIMREKERDLFGTIKKISD